MLNPTDERNTELCQTTEPLGINDAPASHSFSLRPGQEPSLIHRLTRIAPVAITTALLPILPGCTRTLGPGDGLGIAVICVVVIVLAALLVSFVIKSRNHDRPRRSNIRRADTSDGGASWVGTYMGYTSVIGGHSPTEIHRPDHHPGATTEPSGSSECGHSSDGGCSSYDGGSSGFDAGGGFDGGGGCDGGGGGGGGGGE